MPLANKAPFQLAFERRSGSAASGTATAVISSGALDGDGDCLDPNGLDTSLADTNCPLVNSHNCDGIENLIGNVTNIRVSSGKVYADFNFATDVPENDLARLAKGMSEKGFLKGCSVGFKPLQAVKPGSKEYNAALQKLNLPAGVRPARIITKWRLIEVSLCIIPCNPEALIESGKAAGLSEHALEVLTKSFTTTPPTTAMPRLDFLSRLHQTAGVKPELEQVEKARAGNSPTEMLRAVAGYQRAQLSHKQFLAHEYLREVLSDPQTRFELGAECKHMVKARLNPDEQKHIAGIEFKAMSEASAPGAILMSTLMCQVIRELTAIYGVYQTLGVVIMPTGTTKFARVSAEPSAVWYSRAQQPDNLSSDIQMTGASLSGNAGSLIVYIEISEELLQDAGVDITQAVLVRVSAGIAAGLDGAAFGGTGADDGVSGAQTGIFSGVITNVQAAAAGNTTVASLQREDFLNQMAMVNPAALQRGCRFWTNPVMLPLLMTIKAGNAGYLVKSPLDNGGDEWSLNGFPMSLTTAAPATLTPGSTVCAFGHGPSYNVGIREEFEFMLGRPKFNQALYAFRAITRARCDMDDQTWFALLNLAAA